MTTTCGGARSEVHAEEAERPCPRCGFVRWRLPSWAKLKAPGPQAIFALDGTVYRIVAAGSANRATPDHWHFAEHVTAEILGEPWAGLPEAPCRKADVAQALARLRELPRFSAVELRRAIHLATCGGARSE
jgi:hypothetical protein